MPSVRLDETSWNFWNTSSGSASDQDFGAPETADDFARSVIATICHASVTPGVGRRTFERCMRSLILGSTARVSFRHPGKASAIDLVWQEREQFFHDYTASTDKLRFLSSLPGIGPVMKHSLARRLGLEAPEGHKAVA
jgi:hypothetical protein